MGRNRLRALQLITVLVVSMLLAACEKKPTLEEDIAAVQKVLEIRKQAIDNKDLELYKSLFMSDYADSGVRIEDLLFDMENNFARYEQIEFQYKKTRPSIKMNTSRVVHIIAYEVVSGGSKTVRDQETLYMRRINNQWLISGGVKIGLL